MPTLTGYLSRLFLGRLVATLLGLAALLQLFDLLTNADAVVGRHGDGVAVLVRYAALRLPELVAFLIPLSALIGSLLALAALNRHGELIAIGAVGVPFSRVVLMLLPVAAAVAAVHFLIGERLAPVTTRALYEWDAEADARRRAAAGGAAPAVWLRDGADVVGVGAVTDRGGTLHDFVLFERDAGGGLVGRTAARTAVYVDGGWVLVDGERLPVGAGGVARPERFERRPWPTELTPRRIADLVAPPASLPLRALAGIVDRAEVGTRPPHVYETWLHRRVAVPLSSLALVLLAAPVARALPRGGRGAFGAGVGAAGVALGFLFFVVDGLLLALGEAGAVAPAVAAWGPVVLFGGLGAAGLIRVPRPRRAGGAPDRLARPARGQ